MNNGESKALAFNVGVFGDGSSLNIVIDLKNDAIFESSSNGNINEFNLAKNLPIDVAPVAFWSVAGHQAGAVELAGSLVTVTLASAFTGFSTLSGVLLF